MKNTASSEGKLDVPGRRKAECGRRGEFVRDRLPDWVSYAASNGLVLIGNGRWRTTSCPFHGGSDSMRVNSASGGWVCMACQEKGGDLLSFEMKLHGLEFLDAARKLGALVDDGRGRAPDRPRTLSPRDAMEVIVAELAVLWIIVESLVRGVIPSDSDWQRFNVATGRIEALVMEYRK